MAIFHKPGPAQSIALVGQIPDPPAVPSGMLQRFPELDLYQEKKNAWWTEFSVLLQRDLDQIAARFKADEALIAALQTKIDALTAKVNALP